MRQGGANRLLAWGTRRLTAAGVYFGHGTSTARDEAGWLLGSALGIPADQPIAADVPVTDSAEALFKALVEQRITSRKPAAYLLKEAWFAGRRYFVDERTLVPRSLIGEFIIEQFAPLIPKPRAVRSILDIGTGSGCIAIALAHAFPGSQVDACDISHEALAVATVNVRAQRLGRRVHLVQSDLFQRLRGRRYDLIVSNPPYATEKEFRALPNEYRHEPKLALVAPGRGLAIILKILERAPTYLNEDGLLVIETGNRAPELARLLPGVPFIWLHDSLNDGSVLAMGRAALNAQRKTLKQALEQVLTDATRPHKRR